MAQNFRQWRVLILKSTKDFGKIRDTIKTARAHWSEIDPMEHERRRAPRYQFIAPAELVEETSGARTNSWVANLGSQGCSLNISDPPRAGSLVRVKIGISPRESFQAQALVVHATHDHAGLQFSDVTMKASQMLDKWLATAKFPQKTSAKRV